MDKETEISLDNLIDSNIVFPIKKRFNEILESVDKLNNETTKHLSLIEKQVNDNKNTLLQEIEDLKQKNVELNNKVIKNTYLVEQLNNNKNMLLKEVDKLKLEIAKINKELFDSISSIKWEFN